MTVPVPAVALTEADRTLAAEYVLGTLDAEERRETRARIAADPPFAGLVRLWERRLSPLHELAVPVTPPPSIWRVIVADLKAAPPSAPVKPLRKAPSPADLAPRVVAEARPGRAPAPRHAGPVATVRRLFGLALPARAPGPGNPRPKRSVPAPPPAAPPVPVALRVPGGRTLGGAIQDAVAAGLLPPAPPLPEPPPPTAAPERPERLPLPLKLAPPAPPAPPRPRPIPEPLTPPPAFIFLEPDPPPPAEAETTAGVDQAASVPPSTDAQGAASGAPPPPPAFAFLDPEPAAPASPPAAGQAASASDSNDVLQPLPGTVAFPAVGVGADTASPSSPSAQTASSADPGGATALPPILSEKVQVPVTGGGVGSLGQVAVQSTAAPEDESSHALLPEDAAAADLAVFAAPVAQGAAQAVPAEAAAAPASLPETRSPDVPVTGGDAARVGPSGAEPAAASPAVLPSTPIEPSAAEPPSADPAAGAKGEEEQPLPGWAAVVASGVVSALPDPAAGGEEPAAARATARPRPARGFPWRTATLTLTALLVAVAAFAGYREWFWPRDGQWVGVLQSEPLPTIAVRLDPDSGVIFVRSFAPAPPEGEINRLWLLVPGKPPLLLGAFTAGVSDRAPALAGLGRSRLGAAEVVVTQEPKLGSGAASAQGDLPGKIVYRGRLAPE